MVGKALVSSLFRLLLPSFPPSFDCGFSFPPSFIPSSLSFFLPDLALATVD